MIGEGFAFFQFMVDRAQWNLSVRLNQSGHGWQCDWCRVAWRELNPPVYWSVKTNPPCWGIAPTTSAPFTAADRGPVHQLR